MISKKEADKIIEFSKNNWVSIDIVTKEFAILKVLDLFKKQFKIDYFVLKWWTSLSLFYWSWRFSEDIDLDMLLKDNINEDTQTERARIFLKKLDTKTNWLFQFEVKEKIARWVFNFTWNFWIPNTRIKFDIRLKAFTDWHIMSTVKEKSDLLLEMWFPLEFECISSNLILSNKLICIWWREKWRDIYDFHFLMKNWYKADLEYIINYLKEYNETDNVFYWLNTKEEFKEKLQERISYLENSHWEDMFKDINEFLIDTRKIDKSTFFIEVYEEIENNFEDCLIWEWWISSLEELDFDFEFEEDISIDNIRKKEIIDFLSNWSKMNKNSWVKQFKNKKWDNYVLSIENWFYKIYENWILFKTLERKSDLIDYLYNNYEKFF